MAYDESKRANVGQKKADFYKEALKESLAGLRSLRLGRLRIIYRVCASAEIEIVAVGPRASIYQETYRLIYRTRHRE